MRYTILLPINYRDDIQPLLHQFEKGTVLAVYVPISQLKILVHENKEARVLV
jgi:hypothetical protein